MLTFGSVCSGIEAATEAWRPLGWKAAWYAEIEKFPSRVLAARHPETPNLGDMTKLHDLEVFLGSTLDVLVGGTPCQSFSIAGLRKGLADPRGNLALVFLGLIDRKRPRWVVWENVPGVLSSWSDAPDGAADADVSGGSGELFGGPVGDGRGGSVGDRDEVVEQTNDFDTFLRGLSELGYGVAWAVLDAQHFGVPQRRQRVFVVAHLGASAPAEAVLFDRHCLCGNPPPSRSSGERVAVPISSGSKRGSGYRNDAETADNLIARTVTAGANRQDGSADNLLPVDITNVRIGKEDISGCIDAGQDRGNRGQGVLDTTLAFKPAHYTRGKDGAPSEVSPPVTAEQDRGDTHPVVYSIMPQNSGKDYKARPVEVAQPLMAAGPGTGAQGGDVVLTQIPRAPEDDVAGTLLANHGNIKTEDAWGGKLIAFSAQDHGADIGKDLSPTVRKGGDGGGVQVAVCIPGSPAPEEPKPEAYDMRGNGDGETTPTLTGHHAGAVSDFSPMVFEPRFVRNGRGAPDEIVPPLKAQSGETGKGDAAPVVCIQQNGRSEVRKVGGDGQIAGALAAHQLPQQQNYLLAPSAVRRLTPRECERLQGFPDDYTLIPGGNRTDDEDYAETVEYLIASGFTVAEAMALADTPDVPRYKALGNSMAVPVMEWLGRRINEVHELLYGKK